MMVQQEEYGEEAERDQEALSLLSRAQDDGTKGTGSDAASAKQMTRVLSLCLFAVCSLIIVLSTLLTVETPFTARRSNRRFVDGQDSTASLGVDNDGNDTASHAGEFISSNSLDNMKCPRVVKEALNAPGSSFDEEYSEVSEHIIESNITHYIENFRQ